MRYLIGSKFYNLNTPTSDKDYIQFVFPTKDDLFKANFTSKQTKNENGDDVVVKDIRLLLKGLKKGSLQIFEVLYSEPIEDINKSNFFWLYGYFKLYRNRLFEEQKGELLKAIQGELTNRYKKFQSENTVKGYVNCCKLVYLFYAIHFNSENPFELIMNQDNETKYLFEQYKKLRVNCNSFKDINDYVDRKEQLVKCFNDIKSEIIKTNEQKPTLEYIEKQIFSEVFRNIC